ncbi:MAG: hypothetical protein RPR97_04435 [Colwellia sp.]
MILLIADSVCGGFGQTGKKSFVHYSLEAKNINIWDHSASGMSTELYRQFLKTGVKISKEQHDLYNKSESFACVVIALGNVDSKGCFQNNNILSKFVPQRYRAEKIDARPYYSTKSFKKIMQLSENTVRMFFRYYLFHTGNLTSKVSYNQMESNVIALLDKHSGSKIILISPSCISDRLFPGSFLRFEKLNKLLVKLSSRENVSYFDMRSKLNKSYLMEDEFHLNQQGHQFLKDKFGVHYKTVMAK